MKVLLIANYLPDAQQSMQRFADMLAKNLPAFGVDVEVLRPAPRANARQGRRGLDKYLGYIDKLLLFPRLLRHRARRLSAETVVHICDHSNAFYTDALQGVPHLVTCHDLLAVRSARGEFGQHTTSWSGRRLQSMIIRGLNGAQRVACVSDATRSDLLRLTRLAPQRGEVIYNGLNYPYEPMPSQQATALLLKQGIQGPFILHVGSDHWYKNRSGLLAIYEAIDRDSRPPLVIAGEPLSTAHQKWIQDHNIAYKVHVISNATNEVLRALYSSAALLLFPSWFEGFGWPIAEAQACGCPVVTTFQAPMTEIGGHAAVYINPDAPTHSAERVRALLHETRPERESRAAESMANAARFSTDRMIEGYLATYRTLLDYKPHRQRVILS